MGLDPSAAKPPLVGASSSAAAFCAAVFRFFFFLLDDVEEDALGEPSLGGSDQPGAAVRTSTPVSVMRSVSSNCADALPSTVAAVHCDSQKH